MSAQRHPVTDLLTDEMRERIRAATFKASHRGGFIYAGSVVHCPLGVALAHRYSPGADEACKLLGASTQAQCDAVRDFIHLSDEGLITPEDVKPMLGVEP
jgi:hypothetical protein